MAYFTNEQILQQNGQLSTDEWLVKSLNEPGYLGRRYVLPSLQTNVSRQAVLGYYLEANSFIAPAQTFEIIMQPATESRAGLGMYGKPDVNYVKQKVLGHKGGTQTVFAGQSVEIGKRIDQWDSIGNDKIAFKLTNQISVTKKFSAVGLSQSDLPQSLSYTLQNILHTILQTYEDAFLLELIDKGVNLNNEFIDGDITCPVCAYVQDPTKPVDIHWNNASSVDNRNNAFVQLVNNVNTYLVEIGLNQVYTEMIVKPVFVNKLKNSANWVFNSYANTQQTVEMRTGVVGEILNGVRVFQAPRLSARYGNTLYNGLPCPDFFLIDRSRLMVPKLVIESLHLVPAPSDYFQTILIKALEYFGVYGQPVTLEDYQAQLNGYVRCSGISYGYLFTNPNPNGNIANSATLDTFVYSKGFNIGELHIAYETGAVWPSGTETVFGNVKLIKTYVSLDGTFTDNIQPDCLRVICAPTVVIDVVSGTATIQPVKFQIGVVSDVFQNVTTFQAKFDFTVDNSDVITSNALTFTLQTDPITGFQSWAIPVPLAKPKKK